MGKSKVYAEGEVGTRFCVVENGDHISVDFSHRELAGWTPYASTSFPQPIFTSTATNTELNLWEESGVIVGLNYHTESKDGAPAKKTYTLQILVKGSPSDAQVQKIQIPPHPNASNGSRLVQEPILIQPDSSSFRSEQP
ncbi:MAG: hypothetical protein ACQKBT_02600 [Puniceicoccales bacterium]